MKLFYIGSLVLCSLTLTQSECTTSRGVLGACLIVTGNFDINNCTECIKTSLPAAVSDQAAVNETTTTDDAPQDASGGDCATIDGLLCDTVTTCSESCAGSFCDNAFIDLLVCEAKFYVPDCGNLTADSCQVPDSAGAASATGVGSMTLMLGIWGASVLASLVL